jgi:amino acid transporter
VLLVAELAVTVAETIGGLARPAGGHLTLAGLSPGSLFTAGFGTFGALAVIAVLGFVGFEQAPVFSEETRAVRRTVPAATYVSLGAIAMVYAGASWAMLVHAGPRHVAAAAAAQGPGLLYGLAGSGVLSQAAQVLFMTSLLAAALAFHNVVWRYMFALAREHVLPPGLAQVSASGVPHAASLVQSATGLAVIAAYAAAGWDPVTRLFFWLGTTGGFGILCLLALTSASVITFFAGDHRGVSTWQRAVAPGIAAVLLAGIVVLAVQHYAALLGVAPGDPAAWLLPASFGAAAALGAAWGLVLRFRRPAVYARIGHGGAVTPGAAS